MTVSVDIDIQKKEKIGFIYAVLAAFTYASMASVAKLATEVPSSMIVFFRNLVCFLCLAPVFLRTQNGFKTKKLGLFTFRAFAGFMTLNCFYYAGKYLPVVDSVLLINTNPLFIPLVILIWDRMKISKKRAFFIFTGFVGVLFILKPKMDFINIAGVIGLGAGVFMATSMVALRKLSKTEPTERILFYFFVGNLLFGVLPMIYNWKTLENPMMWVYVALVGLTSFLFQFLTTKAYSYATPTKVSPISFSAIVFSGVLGWLFWNKIPDLKAWLGALLVIVGGIAIVLDKSSLQPIKSRKALVKE